MREVCASLQNYLFFRTSGLVLSFSQATFPKLQNQQKKSDNSILLTYNLEENF